MIYLKSLFPLQQFLLGSMYPLPIGKLEVDHKEFWLSPEARGKHFAIFGKSGVGKTTLMRNMALCDIHAGNGVTVIDPHGSLIDDLLNSIPRWRTNDVIYFDPKDTKRALGLNILETVREEQRALIVSNVVSIFRKIWEASWGPRLEDILRNGLYALIEQPEPTSLIAFPKLLTNAGYRSKLLRRVQNPVVREFFRTYDDDWKESYKQEAIAPVLNKIRAFLINPLLRDIIGQSRSSFDFRWLMDERKILLCDLSKGALGEDVSSLLGSLLVTKLALAALSREDIPEEKRRQHFLYIDEVHNFTYGVDLPTILSEARKYRLSLVIATQTINQLQEKSIDAVFGNCATIMSFRVSGDDALRLEREFALMLPARELQHLPDYKLYVRTLRSLEGIAGDVPSDPLKVRAYSPFTMDGIENNRWKVIRASAERYTRPRAQVEAALTKFLAAQV
jgi:energy-coupling factor transporter ATP-binding protein EcfA2